MILGMTVLNNMLVFYEIYILYNQISLTNDMT